MATCGDALASTRAAARTDRLESLLRAHVTHLAVHPADMPVRREARAIARELKRRCDPEVKHALVAAALARAVLLTLDEVDPVRTLDECEAILVLDPDQRIALELVVRAATAAGLRHVAAWAAADLRVVEGPAGPSACPALAAFVGDSPPIRRARVQLSTALDHDWPVLLQGEPGTGKELAARLLHEGGRAPTKPFRVLDAGAPGANLAVALFGDDTAPGALEAGGTLLITNAHFMTPPLQAQLARAVRVREVRRAGDRTAWRADVPRLVLATPPLTSEWPASFVHLAHILRRIELPSLRARPEDIAPLAAHLLRGERSADGHPLRLRQAALEAFMRHAWPRNIDDLADALGALVRQHRARRQGEVGDRLLDSVAGEPRSEPRDEPRTEPATPTPAQAQDLADRVVAGVATNDPAALAEALVGVAERLGARWVALWRVDDAGRARVLQLGDRALADPASAQVHVFEPAPPGSVVARALAAWKPISVLDAGTAEVDLLKVLSAGGLAPRTLLAVPVTQGTRALGVLLAADRVGKEFFTYEDLGLLGAVAAGIARCASERGLDFLSDPDPAGAAPRAEPPVGWTPLPAHPRGVRGPRFTREGLAAAMSAAVVFTALMLGATHVLGS